MMRGTMSSNFLVPNAAFLFPCAPRELKGGITPNNPQGESSDFKLLMENLRRSPKWLYNQNSLGIGVFSPFESSGFGLGQDPIRLLWSGQGDLMSLLEKNSTQFPGKDGVCSVPIELKFTPDSKEMAGFAQTAQLVINSDDLNNQNIFGKIEIPARLVIKIEDENADLCDLLKGSFDNAIISKSDKSILSENRLYPSGSDVSNTSGKVITLPVMVAIVADENTELIQAGKLMGQLKLGADEDTESIQTEKSTRQFKLAADENTESIQVEKLVGQLKELGGKLEIRFDAKAQPQTKENGLTGHENSPETGFGKEEPPLKGAVAKVDVNSQFREQGQFKNDYLSNSQDGDQGAAFQDSQVIDQGRFLKFSELIKNKEPRFDETRIWTSNLWTENKAEQLGFENLKFNRNPFLEVQRLENWTENILSRIRTNIFDLKDGLRSEAKMKLEPESLGSLRISLVTENSNVSAKIVVDNLTTKQIIQSNLPQLKESLSQQGLNLEKCDISMGQENRDSFHDAQAGSTPDWGNRKYMRAQPDGDVDSEYSSFGIWKNNYVFNCLA